MGCVQEQGEFYLVQEYIEGKTLEGETLAGISPISQEQAFSLLTSLLRTLQYIQEKNIIHCNIKPENIIIRSSDGLPVLIDFCVGKVRRYSGAVISSLVIGTPGFMSPEQMMGHPIFSSDLYALGFTIIYALTGKLPVEFQPDPKTGDLDWKKSIPNLDPTLEKVLDKAIKDDPTVRYATADEMYQDLHSSQPKKIDGIEIDYQNINWKRGNKILAFASGGAFLGGIIAQIPGSIIGAVMAGIYGNMVKEERTESMRN
ncbi:MAG: serine/threonine-protein kinase [Crocosphaera sp.]|nr:serine/threonine-protein kinase [Crocosphaera sp.]